MSARWWRLTRRTPEPLVMDCDRCCHGTPDWVAVTWQHERNDGRGGIEVTGSDLLGVICPGCAGCVQDEVAAAVVRTLDGEVSS